MFGILKSMHMWRFCVFVHVGFVLIGLSMMIGGYGEMLVYQCTFGICNGLDVKLIHFWHLYVFVFAGSAFTGLCLIVWGFW